MLTESAVRAELVRLFGLRLGVRLLIVQLLVGSVACFGGTVVARLNTEPNGNLLLGRAALGYYVAFGCACLAAAVVTATLAGGDVRYGTLTSTLLADPDRDRLLAAKFLVGAALGAVYGVSTGVFGAIVLLGFADGGVGPSWQLAAVALAGTTAAACWGLIGTGLGLLLGSPLVAVIVLLTWCPLGELAASALAAAVGWTEFGSVLPCFAALGTIVAGTVHEVGPMPGWPAAPLLVVGWTAAVVATAWYRNRSRDLN
ncbi:hypothetical protein [Skermania piniformis]|uniref:ABC transporter permease n=1 Tax=Skermania pinensis TaxID=39122 RepID=A0ABX8SA62_9ACTN|nr:hypothetical protein [Skermania piniformis]QXQ14668.1 hypothetical protein KV203_04490 [Skermania piniformis]